MTTTDEAIVGAEPTVPEVATPESAAGENSIVGKSQPEVMAMIGRPIKIEGAVWVYRNFSLHFDAAQKVRAIENNALPAVHIIANGGRNIDMKQVALAGKVTMIDFYADWCGPCKKLSPQLEALAKNEPGVYLRKVDIVKWGTPVARQFKIKSIPNVWVIGPDGSPVGTPTSNFATIQKNVARAKQQMAQ